MYARVKLCGRRGTINILCARSCTINPCRSETIEAKPFEDIPGPRSLPVIGTLYKYLPFIGKRTVCISVNALKRFNTIANLIFF